MTEAELRTIVHVSHESGVIENEARNMLTNVFDLTDSEAKEIMVPRIDMTFVDVNASYEKLLEIFREAKYTRLPVYEDTTDNVIGILNVKDLLLYDDRTNFSIRSIMREPFFTYEHKNTAELLKEMQASSLNIAIVLDEYGEMCIRDRCTDVRFHLIGLSGEPSSGKGCHLIISCIIGPHRNYLIGSGWNCKRCLFCGI